MAIKGERLPLPPPDLLLRRLPLKRIAGAAYRIHLGERDCLYFGRSGMGRFDDPLGQYGVLYAGLTPEGAFAEVFLRNLALMLIAEADVRKRSISAIEMHDLKCVDLSGSVFAPSPVIIGSARRSPTIRLDFGREPCKTIRQRQMGLSTGAGTTPNSSALRSMTGAGAGCRRRGRSL